MPRKLTCFLLCFIVGWMKLSSGSKLWAQWRGNLGVSSVLHMGNEAIKERINEGLNSQCLCLKSGLTPFTPATQWKSVSSTFVCLIRIPCVMVLGDGASGDWLGHEGGVLLNGISSLIKEDPGRSQLKDSCLWTRKCNLTRPWICQHLDLGLWEINLCCLQAT